MRGDVCMAMDKEYLSITEVARILGVNRFTVWTAIRRGDIKSVRMGSKWLTKISWVDQYLSRSI